FIEEATNGKIKDFIKVEYISDEERAILINAIHFLGKWKHSFDSEFTYTGTFRGYNGKREIEFMVCEESYRVNQNNSIGTLLMTPYKNEKYTFFYLLPFESSNIKKLRNALTGEALINIVKGSKATSVEITVPKLKVESDLDGIEVLTKLGVKRLF
ncbi:hypothetical protein PENTCL1PPCAC_1506, partial [Pristionchus entomophagus]